MVKGTRLRTCHANGNWSGSLPTCADINECVKYSDLSDPAANNDVLMAGGVCHVFAQCFNTIGSFMCMCNVGYHGNGRECYPAKTTFMSDEAMKRRPRVSQSSCGTIGQVNSSRVRRIVGGKISAKAAWPWQAAIYYKDRGRNFLFNGALIKSRWVLTVANAVLRGGRPIKPRKLKVILGELNRDKEEGNEQTLRVKRIITHPGYSRTNLSHNIALLELAKPAKLNNYIRKVCITKRKRDVALENPPNYGTVAGWGTTRKIRLGYPVGPLSAKLRQVTVPIVSNEECKRASIYTYDSAFTFCAGFRRKPLAPCFGDVGSPMVIQSPRTGRWVIVGLFGWSEGCAQPRKYAYYTRVSKYRRWIHSIVRRTRLQ
ncbi:coagulation factor IX isoform X2 [Nematostella vectensis]|nr:coagulation factor IX isoform X2 [Nematostella vectensis]